MFHVAGQIFHLAWQMFHLFIQMKDLAGQIIFIIAPPSMPDQLIDPVEKLVNTKYSKLQEH